MKLDLDALRKSIAVADGAWSTQLHARGVPSNEPAETANLSNPQLVLTLAKEYLAAGAQILTTNTFGANRATLARHNRTGDVAMLNRLGAQLACEAASKKDVTVVGTIGPSGKIMAVREAREEDLRAAFAEQAAALAEGGAEAIGLESFSELSEILLALRATKHATGLPVIASMSFDSGPNRTRTLMGSEAGPSATALEDAGADIIGCNCGSGIADALPAVFALRSATTRPLWAKPSAGLPDLEGGRPVYRQTPDEFGEAVPTLLQAGVNVIGGCCGTGPEHIRRVAALVESRRRGKG